MTLKSSQPNRKEVFAGSLSLSDVLLKLGYDALNPMQERALPLLGEPRLVVSAATASGKTLLALLKIVKNNAETKSKALYIVPLRALASEKHAEFEKALAPFGVSVGVSTGDYDSSSDELAQYDVVIVTSEKLDSLLRHKARWLEQVGLVVADEVHLLNDEERGATLEIVLTKLKRTGAQLLCLSGTLPNAEEVASWLGAELFQSTWRPTPLVLGVCDHKKIFFENDAITLAAGDDRAVHDLVALAVAENKGKGQALVFASTRKNAEAIALELAETVKKKLSLEEAAECAKLAERVLNVLSPPTRQCKLLASCLRGGVSFHHAGIESRQRALIEDGFKRKRCLKAIVCTTTLAMGVDYPASWVIVRDLKRYNGAFSEFLPALEVAQMTGRAGRPRFDNRGIGILLCRPSEKRVVTEKYVFGALENVYSKLASEPVLRSHVLALIAQEYCRSAKELKEFFGDSFYAFQYGDAAELFGNVDQVVAELKEMDFVREKQGVLLATPVGRRTAELYIDPLSAYSLLQFIDSAGRKKKSVFAYLMALNSTTEALPLITASRKEEEMLWNELYALSDDFDWQAREFDVDALDKYKTSKVLNAWINEETEDKILDDFEIPPGVLHARVRNAEWLAYALQELAFMKNASTVQATARVLAKRIKYGVKEELLELCNLGGIGRVRGRRLFNAGVRTIEEFHSRSKDEIRRIIAARPSEEEISSEAED
ncbi:MAG: DEAD/DEAH box helicase [Candidatus Norongarragalinales archaeon]